MKDSQISQAFEYAKARYADLGIDVENVAIGTYQILEHSNTQHDHQIWSLVIQRPGHPP